MSEMTLIKKRYSDMVNFTTKVNKSIIILKKKTLSTDITDEDIYSKLAVNEKEVQDAKANLLQSLLDLESLKADEEYNNSLFSIVEGSKLYNLVIKNQIDKREIEAIVNSIRNDVPLSKSNFLMLDKIISILDNERSILFKKLRTIRR